MLQASLGAGVACAGLTMLALYGVSLDDFPGFNWISVALTVTGVALTTGRWSGWSAPK
jgi:hypothetical protein